MAGVPPRQQVVRQPQNNPLVDLHLLLEESQRLGHDINRPLNMLFLIMIPEVIELLYLAFSNSENVPKQAHRVNDIFQDNYSIAKHLLIFSLLIIQPIQKIIDAYFPGGFGFYRHESLLFRGQMFVSTKEITDQINSLQRYIQYQKIINNFTKFIGFLVCFVVPIMMSLRNEMGTESIHGEKFRLIMDTYMKSINCLSEQSQLAKTPRKMYEPCAKQIFNAVSSTREFGGEETTEEKLTETMLTLIDSCGKAGIKKIINYIQDQRENIEKITFLSMEELSLGIMVGRGSLFLALQSKSTMDYYQLTLIRVMATLFNFDVLSFLNRIVSCGNANNKLNNFEETIKNISSSKNWRNASPQSALMNTVFEQVIKEKVFQLNDINEIPRNLYIVYLYKLLLAHGFNVNTTGDHNILVGYRTISASLADRMKKTFQIMLQEYHDTKTASKQAIAILNDSNNALGLTCLWKVKIDFLSEVPTIYYYLNCDERAIHNSLKLYLNMIKSLPSCMQGIEGKISLEIGLTH